jgi:dihydrofolate reductase
MEKPTAPVVIVAGVGRETRAIGKKNELLWHVPADLKRFKELTLGHPVIMGRKTFESILKILGKPLPGRTNIIVSRDYRPPYESVLVAHSLEEAFALAERENPGEIHIGGGAEIYHQALPYTDRLHLTLYDSDLEGDTFFPEFSEDFFVVKEYPTETYEGLTYQWVDLERKTI